MNTKFSALAAALTASASVLTASADMVDRPTGFKIGERMTLRPYVSLSYTYDSNVDSAKHADKLRKNQPKEEPAAEETPAE